MAFDLGALVTRMTVEGRGQFEADIDAAGRKLGQAARQGDEFGLALGTMGTKAERFRDGVAIAGAEVLSLGERSRLAFQQVGTGLTIAGLAVSALVGLAVAKYAEYDAAISRSVAVTGVYGNELAAVRKLTQELGASTVFTATEAAQGVTELGKAGVKTTDILGGGLAGSLNLAAAGELAVADAAAITASTLNQFSLKGQQATHVSDLLAAAAGKAQGSVGDLAQGLKQSGLVAAQMGLSVEDATGTLAAFASAGLIGSDAGTSFRTMLLNLATPTKQQAQLMEEFNLQAYDAQGNFVGITALAGQLKTAFVGSTQAQRDYALGIIFGSDAIRAANVLYKEGEAGIRDWISAVDDSGYAARVAGINQDNLRGDLEKLGGAFDTALIKTGAGADGVLRDLIQSTTELVNGFSQLPDWLQQVVIGGAALAAGMLLLAGATSIGISRMIEMRAALAVIRAEMPLTAGAMARVSSFLAGPWGLAIAGAIVGVEVFSNYLKSLQASGSEVANSLQTATTQAELFAVLGKGKELTAWRDVTADLGNMSYMLSRVREQNANVWLRFTTETIGFREAVRDAGAQLAELAGSDLPAAQRGFRLLTEGQNLNAAQFATLLDEMPAFKQALIDQASAMGINVATGNEMLDNARLLELAQGDQSTQTLAAADAYKAAADEAEGLGDQLVQLIDLINESNGIGQDAVSQNAQYRESLAGISQEIADQRAAYEEANGTLEGFSLSLDENTVAGSANANMLAQVAADAQSAAAAQFEVDKKTMSAKDATDKYLGTLAASRQALIDQAIANGFTAEEVQRLIDKVFAMPTQKETKVLVETAEAENKVNRFITLNDGRRIRVFVDTATGETSYRLPGGRAFEAYGGVVRMMAQGGALVGSNAGAVAQIKRAGDVTVWAEHDTGGEAYVPFALDRRARSEAIMQQVASIFGGTYIPAGARAMAAGGVDVPQTVSGPGRVVNLGGIHMHNPITKDPVEDAREAAQLAVAVLSV